MGITGLLQFIKDAAEPISVKKYKGQTVAVDTYCWLHKGAFSCAEKLAKGEPTDQYVWYCMKFVDMLLTFGVKPVLVFDGRNLPSKQEVEKSRRARREANLQKGRQLLREGKLSEARDCFTRCVNITPAMAHNLIKVARARGVDCVVAPYEADAQLAFLNKSGLAQAVITEDSDLLAFGCKKVILKMDKQGNGLEIDQSNLGRCHALGNVFTEEKFRYMCILSGCDYLASLHGIGLGKACKLLRLAKDPDILKVIRKMGQYLKISLVVPEQYIEGFIKANNTFLYQLVFDPVRRRVVPLNPYPENVDPATLSYAGLNVGDEKGLQMALGNLDINTMERIDDFSPYKPIPQLSKPRSQRWNDSPAPTRPSIWSGDLKPASAAPPCSAASSDRPPSTRGKERVVSLEELRLPCRELQVKRPRDSSISDQDMFQQYSSCSQKRSRSDQEPDKPTLTCPSRPRNRFATLLQRRNQEAEGDGQATRSRFFSSPSHSTMESAQEHPPHSVEPTDLSATQYQSSPSTLTDDSDVPSVPSVDTPVTSPSPSSTSPNSASQGLRLFHWSGSPSSREQSKTPKSSSGLATLQQFQFKRESFSSSSKTLRSSGDGSYSCPSSTDGNPEEKCDLPDSLPSQDSAYGSQCQPCITSCHEVEVPTYRFPASHHGDAEMNLHSGSEPEQSPPHPGKADKKPSTLRSNVSGLSKLKSNNHGQVEKVPMLGPARASGLRKKSVGSGKKVSSVNNENSPVVQATISSLWKNFSFKKDSQKMTPCKEGKMKPMSPVKENLLISSAQTDSNLITSF